ncbi:MAG: hypothetical protein ACI94Y_002228 [Maribacter sp.]|jgi:hypothetical protein
MAKKKSIITVEGADISMLLMNKEEYISLTDIAKQANDEPRFVIRNWMSTQNTIKYLGVWEALHNTNFNRAGFRTFKNDFFDKPFSLTPKRWIELTGANGIISKSGRYGGGTFAHKDIAINFCYWLSPEFQVYLIKEFQRLKEIESLEQQETLDWNIKRTLSKINHKIHTETISQQLIPRRLRDLPKVKGYTFASELDLLNVALFGMTAKEWRIQYPKKKGNIRDHSSGEQLVVLANLESHNAQFIKEGLSQDERLEKLNEIAIYQMQVLLTTPPPSLAKLLDNNNDL